MLKKENRIYNTLDEMFPNAKCELNYTNAFELLIAVLLSAQTTDVSVNKVTTELFKKYPNPESLANANSDDVKEIIKPIGLANNKSKNIINLCKKLVVEKNGIIPCDYYYLITLPGVGRKTANVILSEWFKIPRIAVDTHVLRVSNRLGLTDSSDVLEAEEDLMKLYPKENWHHLHHILLFFGRYFCKAKNPNCLDCPLKDICTKK